VEKSPALGCRRGDRHRLPVPALSCQPSRRPRPVAGPAAGCRGPQPEPTAGS